jgi:hypothetical protein
MAWRATQEFFELINHEKRVASLVTRLSEQLSYQQVKRYTFTKRVISQGSDTFIVCAESVA